MVFGNLVHLMLQYAIQFKNFSTAFFMSKSVEIISSFLDELYASNENDESALRHTESFIPVMQKWASTYMDVHGADSDSDNHPVITGIEDIEERFWSPGFGLKGNVDITARMRMDGKEGIVPIEVKTGKVQQSIQHRSQTSMYSLLMADRYGSYFRLMCRNDVEIWYALLYKRGRDAGDTDSGR
jgi:DNA replication ATP-dependent helicase Dna2